MKLIAAIAWVGLAMIHSLPAVGLVSPSVRQGLYGIEPPGSFAILLAHRAAIFVAIVVASLIAAVHGPSRAAVAIAVSISVVGFLIVYVAGGAPAGALRKVALADCVALPLLAIVWIDILRH